jgi:hypothetical protein
VVLASRYHLHKVNANAAIITGPSLHFCEFN